VDRAPANVWHRRQRILADFPPLARGQRARPRGLTRSVRSQVVMLPLIARGQTHGVLCRAACRPSNLLDDSD
jgi:hypothetical protein